MEENKEGKEGRNKDRAGGKTQASADAFQIVKEGWKWGDEGRRRISL